MDPITHAVIGLSVSKLAVNSIDMSNPASLGIVAGSLVPDIDIVMQKWGDYAYLKNHRGATHSLLGISISSAVIALILGGILQMGSIPQLFFWAMIGSLSHLFFDMFNCYGAKLLWPFLKRKFSFGILMSFDPCIVLLLIGCAFGKGIVEQVFVGIFALYIVLQVVMRLFMRRDLLKKYSDTCKKVSIFPAVSGLFKWHFVIEKEGENIIGERSLLNNTNRELFRLAKIEEDILNTALDTPLGRFFSEFTPVFHIDFEEDESVNRYKFIDLRYYVRQDFLHHAILEMDKDGVVIASSFNPYSMNRVNILSKHDLKAYTGVYA